jgi:microcystin degradation protein MlrC
MRVGIISLVHESNTFLPAPTTIELFRRGSLLFGDDIRRTFESAQHEISGFFEGLARHDVEAVPIFYASALPSGVITRQACDQLMEMMFDAVTRAGSMDAYLVAPHGANAGEGEAYRNLDGHWLTRLRQHARADVPVIAVMDPHVNLSRRMVSATTAIITYRTNPHLDQKQRGLEAAELLVRTLRGEVRPTQAAAFPPMIMNIERQNTEEAHCQRLYGLAERCDGGPACCR